MPAQSRHADAGVFNDGSVVSFQACFHPGQDGGRAAGADQDDWCMLGMKLCFPLQGWQEGRTNFFRYKIPDPIAGRGEFLTRRGIAMRDGFEQAHGAEQHQPRQLRSRRAEQVDDEIAEQVDLVDGPPGVQPAHEDARAVERVGGRREDRLVERIGSASRRRRGIGSHHAAVAGSEEERAGDGRAAPQRRSSGNIHLIGENDADADNAQRYADQFCRSNAFVRQIMMRQQKAKRGDD